MKKIGLALGAGGARGLAHITILEVFEELEIKPHIISGSSIGAIVAVSYASGLSTNDMKKAISEIILRQKSNYRNLFKGFDVGKLWNLVDLSVNSGGIIKGERFNKFLGKKISLTYFKELYIPVKIITTNFNDKTEKIFDSGEILPAVKASFSLPMLFAPVEISKNLYLDGGLVNPLPYDILQNSCDIVVAIDVSSKTLINAKNAPSLLDTLFSSFQIMQNSILQEKLKTSAPDILIKTDIPNVRLFEFNKAEYIWEHAEKYKFELKSKLEKLL